MKITKYLLFGFIVFYMLPASAQKTLGINSILDSIRTNNPMVMMYDAEVRSMDEAAKGAKSWMPPEISTGLWIT